MYIIYIYVCIVEITEINILMANSCFLVMFLFNLFKLKKEVLNLLGYQ